MSYKGPYNLGGKAVQANDGVLDVSLGDIFVVEPAGDITFSIENTPTYQAKRIEVHIIGGDVHTITWPDDAQNSYVPTAYDIVRLTNPNGGADWYLEYVGSAA